MQHISTKMFTEKGVYMHNTSQFIQVVYIISILKLPKAMPRNIFWNLYFRSCGSLIIVPSTIASSLEQALFFLDDQLQTFIWSLLSILRLFSHHHAHAQTVRSYTY